MTVKPYLEYNSRNRCTSLPCRRQLSAHFLQYGISTERSKTFSQRNVNTRTLKLSATFTFYSFQTKIHHNVLELQCHQ